MSAAHDTGKPGLIRAASYASVAVALTLVIAKVWAWQATGSIAMLSSLADSILDVIASLITFTAVRVALQPADSEHRFGHGKAEGLAALAQALQLLDARPRHTEFLLVTLALFQVILASLASGLSAGGVPRRLILTTSYPRLMANLVTVEPTKPVPPSTSSLPLLAACMRTSALPQVV